MSRDIIQSLQATQLSQGNSGSQGSGRVILSIDGGGVRGLSSLYIIREILQRLQQNTGLLSPPLANEVFHMAGGTGTGGLIVIMLFRLGMSIDEAIREYVEIGKSVFPQISEEARSLQLEIAVGKMIQRQNGVDEVRARKMPMRVPMNSTKSRAFVCAGRKENVTKPIHFPTWNPTSRGFIRPNCTVMEAVRATCATPTIFKDVPILEEANIEPLQYTGADLRWNNPVLHVWEEAKAEFTSLNISHIVSIGTGATGIIAHGPDFSTTLKNIARDCETTYEEAAQMLQQEAPKIEFIRLNVEQGLQDMSWKEWEKFGVIKAHTEAYLQVQEVDQKLENLVTHVQGVCEFQVSVL